MACKSRDLEILYIEDMKEATEQVRGALAQMLCDIISLKPLSLIRLGLKTSAMTASDGDKICQALIRA